MGNYYLDIETTGLDEVENKITTIQYVELERGTGKQLGELTILKEWELGEKEMLRKFIEDSPISNKYDFDFIVEMLISLSLLSLANKRIDAVVKASSKTFSLKSITNKCLNVFVLTRYSLTNLP